MDGNQVLDEWKLLQEEGEIAFDNESVRETGQMSEAIWRYAWWFLTELFSCMNLVEDHALKAMTEKQYAEELEHAEEHLARGILTLALLAADVSIHKRLRSMFLEHGIIHPYNSHVGFRIRKHPTLSKKFGRLLDKHAPRSKEGEDKSTSESLMEFKRILFIVCKEVGREL